jgi:predicted phage tail protein
MIRTIHLHGGIAEAAGIEVIDLDVNSPRELIAGLRSQVKNFRQVVSDFPEMCIVLSNTDKTYVESITPEIYNFPLGPNAECIHLIPPVQGSGEGAAMALAAYIGTSVVVASIIIQVAVSVVLGFISKALSSSPDTSGGGAAADARPSFLFNGAVNVVDQGYAVPIVYGIHSTGSIVVSAGVTVAQIAYVPPPVVAQPASPPPISTQWGNGQFNKGGGGH